VGVVTEFLGDEMVKDKGLNCKLVVAKKVPTTLLSSYLYQLVLPPTAVRFT
jgi:hypothetical protein